MKLLERDAPLLDLCKAQDEVAAGHGRIVLVSGEAGIGKTALVEHFVRGQIPIGRVLWGACDNLFTPRPLGPLYDIAGQVRGELAHLLQGELDRNDATLLEQSGVNIAIFSACLNELRTPTTLVIEDIQWADEATLDLLKYLGRRIQHTHSLLIATYRDDELGPRHPLRLLLGDLVTGPAIRRLPLSPLSIEGVRSLAGARALDAATLHRQTGGNPFFVTEALAAAPRGGPEGSPSEIPATIRDAVLARCARLSRSGRAALNAAAVIGPRIEPWLLTAAAPADVGAVEESLALGILAAQGDWLAFRHELARQTILAAIPPHQRVALHQAVLNVLGSSPAAQQDITRLAHHAEAAADRAAILIYAPAAGREARHAGMFQTAATLWALALRYAADLPPLEQAALYENYALSLRANPDKSAPIDAYRRALEKISHHQALEGAQREPQNPEGSPRGGRGAPWAPRGSPPQEREEIFVSSGYHSSLMRDAGPRGLPPALMEGRILVRMATMLMMNGETEEAEQATNRALSILEPLSPSLPLALAYKNRASLLLMRGAPSGPHPGSHLGPVALAEKSVALAEQLGDIYITMSAYETLGLCWLPLDHGRGRDYLEKTLALALAHQGYWRASSVYPNLIMTYVDIYQLDRAEELSAQGAHFTAEHDMAPAQFAIQSWQALLDLYRGRWREAAALTDGEPSGPLKQSGQPPGSRIPALVALGRLHARRGEPGAEKALEEALALAHAMNQRQRLGFVYAARAEAAWLDGDPKRMLTEAHAPGEVCVENQQPGFAAELAYWRWRAGEQVETFDWMVQPFVLEIQGDWRRAAAAWAALGCPYEQARALADGDTEAQLAALTLFEQLGARPMMDVVRHRLRTAGVQTLPRGPRPATKENPFQLTNRQVEILRLLTEELTNAEIAARLTISAKTVDHHVSAILAKLDVSSRAEAAELARHLRVL